MSQQNSLFHCTSYSPATVMSIMKLYSSAILFIHVNKHSDDAM
jgi:hypothetical protein